MELSERIEQTRRDNPDKQVDCYVLFSSHTDAMELYGLVRGNGLGARSSTTPRQARSSCGVALLIDCDDALAIEGIANDNGVPVESIVPLVNQINPNRDIYC
ncbi:MAG: DUF3343 domain-containing protein [Atopobiaceae bacterium]|nr:DUF3343 domain-containing protein [Atopobiaceae bacterium]